MVLSIMILGAQCGSSSQQCARGWWYWYWGYWGWWYWSANNLLQTLGSRVQLKRLSPVSAPWPPTVRPSFLQQDLFLICRNFRIWFWKNIQSIFKGTGFCSLASVCPYCNKGRRRKRDNVLALCGLFLTSRNGLKLVQGHFFNRKVMSN